MNTRRSIAVTLVTLALVAVAARLTVRAQVMFDRILHADDEPQNWLTYSGTTMSQRYSKLSEITPENVKRLELKWIYQVQSLEKFEATPLVVDGVMYTVSAPNDVIALDAATGRVFWTYSYTPSTLARLCCGRVNRGLAMLGHTLFMGTIDGHLIALDAKSGGLVWNLAVGGARAAAGYGFTMAPLVLKDKVLIGSVGGEFGVRGFLVAVDAKTGKEAWRFNTVPGPGEKGHETWAGDSWKNGGGPLWMTGSYDPALNLTYWGIGNPGPDWNGDARAGDNLYTESVVALDADTGAVKWHFQFTPHDEFDYDSVQVPVLADMTFGGRPRKVMLWANRNGYMYVLDRTTGEFLLGKPFVKTTWTTGLDDKGRPMNVKPVTPEGTLIYPGNQGGTNWYPPSFSPRTGLFYIPSWMDTYATYIKRPVEYADGQRFTGALPVMSVRMLQPGPLVNRRLKEEGYGAIQAFDPKTGARRWSFDMADMTDGGVLTTATDLLFAGGREGYFFALDARTGTLLWKASVGGAVSNGPIAYAVNGKQHVAIAAGNALLVYALK
ncbi:MAG TPA: PQQ-dependent dehydrogenase, methanol/ethanol family [Vicinamibacterales bacterium]|nr:PQQ-dependent dehydrogenase, methanol/ethanol family [Vicinamibacterales bacterium]